MLDITGSKDPDNSYKVYTTLTKAKNKFLPVDNFFLQTSFQKENH